tara:strand:+ start:1141 stop:1467 length:327 start_codon:yes stop_codon:yes gene_type:complete
VKEDTVKPYQTLYHALVTYPGGDILTLGLHESVEDGVNAILRLVNARLYFGKETVNKEGDLAVITWENRPNVKGHVYFMIHQYHHRYSPIQAFDSLGIMPKKGEILLS